MSRSGNLYHLYTSNQRIEPSSWNYLEYQVISHLLGKSPVVGSLLLVMPNPHNCTCDLPKIYSSLLGTHSKGAVQTIQEFTTFGWCEGRVELEGFWVNIILAGKPQLRENHKCQVRKLITKLRREEQYTYCDVEHGGVQSKSRQS